MSTLGNILWHFPFFGFLTAGFTFIFGLLATITGVFTPLGLGLMQMGKFYLAPFSNRLINEKEMPDYNPEAANKAWETYKSISKIIWIVCFGWWLFIASVFQGIAMLFTIIGIPVGLVIIKNAPNMFNPIGKKCISTEMYNVIKVDEARASVEEMKSKD